MIIGTLIILYYTYNYYGSLPAAKQTALTTSMRVIMLVTAATVVWFNISEIVLEFPALVTPWFQVLNFKWFNASLSVDVSVPSPQAKKYYK